MATLIQINVLIADYFKFACSKKQEGGTNLNLSSGSGQWRPPGQGWLKINTDSSFIKSKKIGVSGVIIRDENGRFLSGLTRKHATVDLLMTEVLALRDGIALASSLGLNKVVLESNCLEAVRACRKEIQKGEITPILEDIWCLKQRFEKCGVTWTQRQGNQVAHVVAALTRDNLLPQNWTYIIPDSVKSFIEKDRRVLFRNTNEGHI